MDRSGSPENLVELLRTLERSRDLRGLARECGLTVREMRRRLAAWRRDLQTTAADQAAGAEEAPPVMAKASQSSARQNWPRLLPAEAVADNPLPEGGSRILEIFTDGASKGNPGPAAIGGVFRQKGGPDLCALSEAIGKTTNNVAEYRAVVAALEHCRRWRVERVHLFLDSELVVRQLKGVYRVKSPDLRPLYQQVVFLARHLKAFNIRHVPREQNRHADYLANQALINHD